MRCNIWYSGLLNSSTPEVKIGVDKNGNRFLQDGTVLILTRDGSYPAPSSFYIERSPEIKEQWSKFQEMNTSMSRKDFQKMVGESLFDKLLEEDNSIKVEKVDVVMGDVVVDDRSEVCPFCLGDYSLEARKKRKKDCEERRFIQCPVCIRNLPKD